MAISLKNKSAPSLLELTRMAMQEPYPPMREVPGLADGAERTASAPSPFLAAPLSTMEMLQPAADWVRADLAKGPPSLFQDPGGALESIWGQIYNPGHNQPTGTLVGDVADLRQRYFLDPLTNAFWGTLGYTIPGFREVIENLREPDEGGLELSAEARQARDEARARLRKNFPYMGAAGDLQALAQAQELLTSMPAQTSQTFTQAPLDFAQGFPTQPPQLPAPDYSATDQALEAARPQEREPQSAIAALAPILAGAARGALQGDSVAEILAGAGSGALLGFMTQQQREQELQARFEQAQQQYEMNRASIMAGRAEDSADRQASNELALYNHKVALHELQLETLQQMQTQVQPFSGGLMVSRFNPSTGLMETSVVRDNPLRSFLAKETIKAALGNTGSKSKEELLLEFGTLEIDPSEIPLETQPALFAALSAYQGLTPDELLEPFGIDLPQMRQAIREELLAEGITGSALQEETDYRTFRALMQRFLTDPVLTELALPPSLGGS